MTERNRALTAEEIIRRYDLENLKRVKKTLQNNKDTLDKTENLLNQFINSVLMGMSNTDDQVDGKITTWFYDYLPTLNNVPANSWNDDSTKNAHLGDLFYNQDAGYVYMFDIVNEVYTWVKQEDENTVQAMSLANSNPDTSDGYRDIFLIEPIPPYKVGDIWFKEDGSVYRCNVARASGNFNFAEWIPSNEYSNDNYASDAKAILNSFKETVTTNYICKVLVKSTRDTINLNINSITKLTKTLSNAGSLTLNNAHEGVLHNLSIKGQMDFRSDSSLETGDDLSNALLKFSWAEANTTVEHHITEQEEHEIIMSDNYQIRGGLNQAFIIGEDYNLHRSDLSYIDTLYAESGLYVIQSLSEYRLPNDFGEITFIDDEAEVLNYISTSKFITKPKLLIDNKEYSLDLDYLNYISDTICDEFIYIDGKCSIIRRVGIDANGNKYALQNETIEQREDIILEIKTNSTIRLQSINDATYGATYLIDNEFTSTFANQVEVNTEINMKAGEIEEKVSSVVDENGNVTSASIKLALNNDISGIKLDASQIDITSSDVINLLANNDINLTSKNISISSTNFSVDNNGNLTCSNATIKGTIKGSIFTGNTQNVKLQIGTDSDGYMSTDNALELLYCSDNSQILGIYGKYWNLDDSWKTVYFRSKATTAFFLMSNGISAYAFNNRSLSSEKKNFKLLDNAIDILKKGDIYSYNWKTETDEDKKHYGLIIGNGYNTPEELLSKTKNSIDTYSMISILWQVAKEHQKKLEILQERNN